MSASKKKRAAEARRNQNQRSDDHVHHHQLWWSFAVAFGLGAAAMASFKAPKNVLIEQDRAPASMRSEIKSEISNSLPPSSLTLLSNFK